MFRNWKTASAVIALTLIAGGPVLADVSIGLLIPSSGKAASYGQQQQNAILLAAHPAVRARRVHHAR